MGWIDRHFGKIKGIYALVNLVDEKIYVGSSNNIKKRVQDHLYLLRRNQHPNYHLQFAFNKYGEITFEIRVLEEIANDNDLLVAEQYWLDCTQCYNHLFGYNIAPSAERKYISDETRAKISAGNKGKTRSKEVRTKISATLKGRPLSKETRTKMMGRVHSEETRRKISEAGKGRIFSDETRAKISAESKGRSHSQEARLRMSEAHKGLTLSQEARAKITQALTGHLVSEETRAKIRTSRKANPLTEDALSRIVEARRVLTPEQVQEIRKHLASGESIRSIAAVYRVNYYTIWNIQKQKTWSHLPYLSDE